MDWKKILKHILFPKTFVIVLLVPISAVSLVLAMLKLEENDILRILSYVLAFYTLLTVCVKAPYVVKDFKGFKENNKYLKLWSSNPRFRVNVSLCGNVVWNGAYAALQLGTAVYHRSAWFYSLFMYYALLALMRFFIVKHTLRHEPGKHMAQELKYYRICGIIFLIMNLSLSGMMLYMIRDGRVMQHSEITTIAMAAYTFTTLTFATINVFRYKKYNSPAMSAAKAISLASALVSMLTLENTMLNTFSKAEITKSVQTLFLSLSGVAISVFVIIMAVYMIVQSSKKLKNLEK